MNHLSKEGGDLVSDNQMNSKETPSFINVSKMAEMIGVSKSTAFNLVKDPGFPAIRIGEKRIIIPYEKFLEWIEDQSNKPVELYRVR